MKKILFLLVLSFPILTQAQKNPLDIFSPLVNYTWSAEGKWNNGGIFKQAIQLQFSLDRKLVVAKTKGFIDDKHTKFGLRNHGIRQFDPKTNSLKFWEFDIFGNLTEGIVRSSGKDIIYEYSYGGTVVTEMWQYKDAKHYIFIVGIFEDGQWQDKFLETEFKRTRKVKRKRSSEY